ncbi:MAG: cytochrome P450 [Nocardioides sp.]|nr:cytochrome P450 [Nocardioides sp.]
MMSTKAVRLDQLTDLTPITDTTGTDPDGTYARLREEWGPVAPVELEPGLPAWLVMGYQDVCEVVHNEEVFSRSGANWALKDRLTRTSGLIPWATVRENAFNHDGDSRRTLRAPLDDGLADLDEHPFARRVRRACEMIMDDFRYRGSADLFAEYGALVPLLAFAEMFGLDDERAQQMVTFTRQVMSTGADAAEGIWNLHVLLREHIALRREQPARDLTTSFVQHPNFMIGGADPDHRIVNAISLMITAGYEMTVGLLVKTLLLMLADRRFSHRLRRGRLDVDQAIEEVLWREPPAYNIPLRFALTDVELSGRLIRRGDAVVPSAYTAHSDPVMSGEDPWAEVGNKAHLAFSTGRHACPARRAGLIIVRTAVQAALDDLPDVALAMPPEQMRRISGSLWARYPVELPVTFTRA